MEPTRYRSVLFASLLLATRVAATSNQTCYWPNGGEAASDIVRRPRASTMLSTCFELRADLVH